VSEDFFEDVKKRKLEQTAFGLIDRVTKDCPLVELNDSLEKMTTENKVIQKLT